MKINTNEELTEAVHKLDALLQDPHPGLMTWCEMYGKLMEAIVEFWENN